ncbi:hypothetical protein PUNSTDRAFT_50620 [Punctularia strigosozonata HHB-11173 SS5]|uniref:uncharacterized protein n=1 Tax=Punctularia strigosozonata (strain HHB-11173) TaxID=741275 RepID=UPI0004416DB0|nr:uncharacterized protein PUNSTDRAFT_50620 [Punctularia strigosozonata HHB-11173 SS5]EIN11744.1 hypothetical protein PUNSTDRAFT_50620 [Punctularia strigosozonata HHB-11173 SS5]
MVRLASIAFLASGISFVAAAPIMHLRPRAFQLLDYADFQISDGVAGNAQAEAAAVFLDPFANVDLATVDADTLDAVQTMREAAESAETDQFNPAIDAATGADADALQVGKIKNKVLKLTGEVQAINIKIAQAKAKGSDTSDLESSLAEEQKKLDTNIATDKASAGAASKGVTGGLSTAAATSAAVSSNVAASTSAAASSTSAAPASSATAASAAAGSFQLLDYADFQISDGTAGNAQAQANAVFVDPFKNVDLATVDDSVADDIETMRQAAEAAETDQFNPAIDAASGDEATALQNGKIKNKVLKLTAEVQGLNIKLAKAQAAGDDTSDIESKITEEQTKLTTNIKTDVAAAGQASKGVA